MAGCVGKGKIFFPVENIFQGAVQLGLPYMAFQFGVCGTITKLKKIRCEQLENTAVRPRGYENKIFNSSEHEIFLLIHKQLLAF